MTMALTFCPLIDTHHRPQVRSALHSTRRAHGAERDGGRGTCILRERKMTAMTERNRWGRRK